MHIDQHKPGAFCWIELATSDQSAAKAFYTRVFGWTANDSPMGPGSYYTMFQLRGQNVGAAYTQQGPELEMGVPPHWNLYIAVESADASAAKAAELGGTVLAGPFDVMSYGRMAVIQDPAGAAFCIWEPKDHSGIQLQGEHATLCWADLNVPNQEAGAKFYGELFGWTLTPGTDGYMHIQNGEVYIGGVTPAHMQNPNAPPHWLIYIQADDCDATTAKATEAGASVYFGPMTMEKIGRMSVVADAQKAVFALFQPLPH